MMLLQEHTETSFNLYSSQQKVPYIATCFTNICIRCSAEWWGTAGVENLITKKIISQETLSHLSGLPKRKRKGLICGHALMSKWSFPCLIKKHKSHGSARFVVKKWKSSKTEMEKRETSIFFLPTGRKVLHVVVAALDICIWTAVGRVLPLTVSTPLQLVSPLELEARQV